MPVGGGRKVLAPGISCSVVHPRHVLKLIAWLACLHLSPSSCNLWTPLRWLVYFAKSAYPRPLSRSESTQFVDGGVVSTRPPASGDPSWQASELAHVPFPHHDTTLGAAFAATARRHPDRPAVVTADRQFSYAELATMAGGIAARLADVPVHDADPHPRPFPGTAPVPPRVGLLLDHGADMVAAILGGLAAGWCYVPLDPTYPVERLRTMAAQAGLSVVLTHARHRELAAAVVEALPVTTELVEFDPLPPAPLHVRDVPPDQPAYVLFTSGSTGRPKGVTHSHRSVLHGITNHVNNLQISPADRTSLVT